MTITKKDVFLYFADQLVRSRRIEIEAAYETDPQVRGWFEELGPTEEDIDSIAAEASAFVRARLDEVLASPAPSGADAAPSDDPTLGRLVELIRAASDQAHTGALGPIFAQIDVHSCGGVHKTMDFTEALSGARPETPAYATGPSGEEWYGQDGEALYINCDVDSMPAGLCWLGIAEADGTVTMHLPKLKLVSDGWVWTEPITDILQGRSPVSPVKTFVLPAKPETRSAFDCDEVRSFLDKLPMESEQRIRAKQFLNMGKNDDE